MAGQQHTQKPPYRVGPPTGKKRQTTHGVPLMGHRPREDVLLLFGDGSPDPADQGVQKSQALLLGHALPRIPQHQDLLPLTGYSIREGRTVRQHLQPLKLAQAARSEHCDPDLFGETAT